MVDFKNDGHGLPGCVVEYISLVLKKMRYGRKVRREVSCELADHFVDALADCEGEGEREARAGELIERFGDAKVLARLIRRGKKRCRPLWKKAIIRGFQGMGVFIILFCFYAVWFVSGRPTIGVDYVARLNEIRKPQVRDKDNGWPYYEKAIELYVEPLEEIEDIVRKTSRKGSEQIRYDNFSNEEQEAITKWIKSNEPAWREYVLGSMKAYFYVVIFKWI